LGRGERETERERAGRDELKSRTTTEREKKREKGKPDLLNLGIALGFLKGSSGALNPLGKKGRGDPGPDHVRVTGKQLRNPKGIKTVREQQGRGSTDPV